MSEEQIAPTERFIGFSTMECAREIVRLNPEISGLQLRAYYYIPDKPSGDDEPIFRLSREEFLEGTRVEEVLQRLGPEWNLALDSPVVLQSGETGHFAMADLAPRKSPESLVKVVGRIREIIVPQFGGGFLLETRKSYHYLGTKILSQDEWQRFLGFCLITSIVTVTPDDVPNQHEVICDYRYVGHSLIRGSTGLRITTRGTKTFEPRVVVVI